MWVRWPREGEGREDVPYIWIRIWMWFSDGWGTLSGFNQYADDKSLSSKGRMRE